MIETTFNKLMEQSIVGGILFLVILGCVVLLRHFVGKSDKIQADYIATLQKGQNDLIKELQESREKHFRLAEERSEENRKQIEQMKAHIDECDADRKRLSHELESIKELMRCRQ